MQSVCDEGRLGDQENSDGNILKQGGKKSYSLTKVAMPVVDDIIVAHASIAPSIVEEVKSELKSTVDIPALSNATGGVMKVAEIEVDSHPPSIEVETYLPPHSIEDVETPSQESVVEDYPTTASLLAVNVEAVEITLHSTTKISVEECVNPVLIPSNIDAKATSISLSPTPTIESIDPPSISLLDETENGDKIETFVEEVASIIEKEVELIISQASHKVEEMAEKEEFMNGEVEVEDVNVEPGLAFSNDVESVMLLSNDVEELIAPDDAVELSSSEEVEVKVVNVNVEQVMVLSSDVEELIEDVDAIELLSTEKVEEEVEPELVLANDVEQLIAPDDAVASPYSTEVEMEVGEVVGQEIPKIVNEEEGIKKSNDRQEKDAEMREVLSKILAMDSLEKLKKLHTFINQL
jgi:hypothetical protein